MASESETPSTTTARKASRGFTGAMMRGFGARDHQATVTGVGWSAPHVRRIDLVSDTLFDDAIVAPTSWLRFWFPDPNGGRSEYQRAYTIVSADPDAGSFTIDVVLHDPAGPASRWAQSAEVGTSIPVTSLGSSRFDAPIELPAGYLVIGDSASLPAIKQILAELPPDLPVEIYLEQHAEADQQIVLTEHPRARVHWVVRTGSASLATAIETRDWSNWKAWAAAEATSLKRIRARLKDEFGFPKSEVYAQAYWSQGRAMGKDRERNESVSQAQPEPAQDGEPQRAPDLEPAARSAVQPTTGQWRATAAGRLLAPLRATLIVAGVLQLIVTLVQLAPWVLVVQLVRLLLGHAEPHRYWTLGITAVVLLGCGTLLSSALSLWLHAVDARFERDLRQQLLGKLSRLPLGWFTGRGSGAVKQLIQDDTLSLHYLLTHAVPDAVAAVVAPLAVLTYLMLTEWRLTLLLFLPVVVYVVTMWIMLVQSGPRSAEAQRWAEEMNTHAASFLDAQPVIRVFGGATASAFRTKLTEYVRFLSDWQRPFSGKKTLIDLVNRPATYLVVIIVFGTLFVTSGSMSSIDLLPFLLLGTTFGARLLSIGYGLGGIREGAVAARRIQVALDEPELATASTSTASADQPVGRVVFDHVSFSYRPSVPVINNVCLTLEPGTITALVGPSGSGKSTLAALLARFHDVGSGAIRVGGRDIRELSPDDLYTQVGFVLQDSELVSGSVAENIALAVPDATTEQIEAAARQAQIHDRILRLPEGYRTRLGPDSTLSGGERQRLVIARAILADTKILVLDEATAFADPESEHLVQRALSRLAIGRTVLIIAHRLPTITTADRIVVLTDGTIVEAGTHDQLLAAGGRYQELWEADLPAATAGSNDVTEEIVR